MKNVVGAKDRERLLWAFGIMAFVLILLCVRVGYIQIVKNDEYKKKALLRQTKDEIVYAERGEIVDRNNQKIAVNSIDYSVWIRQSVITNGKTNAEAQVALSDVIRKLSDVMGTDEKDLLKKLNPKIPLVKLATRQSSETVEKIRNLKLDGVKITQEKRRSYPMKNFASQLIGSVTDENKGRSGLEKYYDMSLRGTAGRKVKSKDASENNLYYGDDVYYSAENGCTLKLTIDVVIQHYAEMAIKHTEKRIKGSKARCIVMNPKTGEILAMAVSGGFDPNNSSEPQNKKDKKSFKKKSNKEKLNYLNKMWRNPLVNDSYEPGSTFKLITTSMALEEGKTSEKEHFNCTGALNVAGTRIRCWRSDNPHGYQSLTTAVGNSCNPVFMTLAGRVGIKKFYEYLGLFGFKETTGIDYPGEGGAIFQDEKTAGPVGLATIGFGQGVSVTPIQLISAINSFGNKGVMLKPRLVKEMLDSKGKIIKKFEKEELRQPVSEETAKSILKMMEYVVKSGGAKKAKVSGYRIGGKTGTANKVDEKTGKYGTEVIGSFIGMAPIDDPKISVLFIANDPSGTGFGSDIAVPGAQEVIKNTLRYMNVPKSK